MNLRIISNLFLITALCFIQSIAHADTPPVAVDPNAPKVQTVHCYALRKAADEAVKRRKAAEIEYNKIDKRYENLGKEIERVILKAVNELNRIDGVISGIYVRLGVEGLTTLTNKLTCGENDRFKQFCNRNKGEFIRLATQYTALLGKRRAAIQILEATDKTQGSRQRRSYGTAMQKWAALTTSINLELGMRMAEDLCLQAVSNEVKLKDAQNIISPATLYSENYCIISASAAPITSSLGRAEALFDFGSFFTTITTGIRDFASNFFRDLLGGLVNSVSNYISSKFSALTKNIFDRAAQAIAGILGSRDAINDFYRTYRDNGKCPLPPSRPRELSRSADGCVSWLGIADALGFSFCRNKIVNEVIQ